VSLFGIETKDDCRETIDELLQLNRRAQDQSGEPRSAKEAIRAVKSRLREYYKIGDSGKGKSKMSPAEEQWFWPAIQKAYVSSPNLNDRSTWNSGLYEIELNLSHFRPK
jgi:hypothetical protein